ncbi:MAG: serine hydrolase domain-containing protein [Lactobacillus sp.]
MNNLEIYGLMTKAIEVKATPGISYSLVTPYIHEIHYLGYTTYTNKKLPVSSGLLYDIASLTKIVAITTRILQLIGDKKLKLTDRVEKFIPNTKYPEISIEELLLHTSGLPADLLNVLSYPDAQAIKEEIQKTNLIYTPRKKVIYSDLNFIILGWIIEKIDGESLDKSITNNVLNPLEMFHTGYNIQADKKMFVPTETNKYRGAIQGKVHDETAYKLNGVSGNAGLFSTLDDLNKFCEMYLNHGVYKGSEIIPAEQIDSLFNYDFFTRTLGWKRWNNRTKSLWHTGFTGTVIALDLENKSRFVCLTNRVCPTRQNVKWIDICRLAVGMFFGMPECNP